VINTIPTSLRSGTLKFSIESTNVGNVELMDVGELQYDFSLKSAQSVINSIFVIPGSMSLAVTDIADNGMSAYASLSAELSGSSFVEKSKDVTLRYQPHGSTASNTFTFRLQYNGLQYDARKGFMTLQLIPAQVKSEAYSTFFSNMTNGYWPFSGIAPSITLTNVKGGGSVVTNYESVTATQFIQKYLASLDPDAVKLELVSGYDVNILNQGTRFPSPGFAGILSRTGFAFSNLSPVTSQYDNDPVSAKVQSLAGMECAITGSAFSVSFYVNRISNSINVSLSNSDLTDIRLVNRERQINAINIIIDTIPLNRTVTGLQALPHALASRTKQGTGWLYGSQFVGMNFVAHAPQFGRGNIEFDSTNTIYNSGATNTYINTDFSNIAQAGVSAYQIALSAVSTQEFQEIEAEVLGISTVKPHQAIKFDSTAPSFTQNKHYRPFSLSYDFKNDKTRIRAHEIP
jgi:hypothetical protein